MIGLTSIGIFLFRGEDTKRRHQAHVPGKWPFWRAVYVRSGGTKSRFREKAVKTLPRNLAAKHFAASTKPFSSGTEKARKPACDNVAFNGPTTRFDHVAILIILPRILPGTAA
jgi:hypothetical protein